MPSKKARPNGDIEAQVSAEKPLSKLEPEERIVRREIPYFASEKEVKLWKAWATADHVITSQKKILTFCMALLSLMAVTWVIAMFLWAWGPPSRMTPRILMWWGGMIFGGIIGVAFSRVVAKLFSKTK